MSRIVIAEDHAIVRRGLSLIVSETDDLVPVGEAGTADELMEILRSKHVELVIMNLTFAKDGVEVLRRLKAEFPRLPVLIFNSYANDLLAIGALRAGASGFIQKESGPEELLLAARKVVSGGTHINPVVADKIAVELLRGGEGEKPHERLSGREMEVFLLLASGKSVSEIAERLKLSVKTVSTHRSRILVKTGLRNNADIIRYVIFNCLP